MVAEAVIEMLLFKRAEKSGCLTGAFVSKGDMDIE